ncbi:amidohydrolase [Roseimaritima ulvae]|uniref:Putative hydrolase YxeP n=1 Tax=Roseimaritima ulvae TaxID=980254 RepID=A0A5B9QHC5_9BACT|nr:amidohydrolase [Roseimaritima ulvae]QEG38468.1 putative hydrolase YxeP [Roseimaritima ulvae]
MTQPTDAGERELKTWSPIVQEIAAELSPQWRELRRYLHRHPELSNEEFLTTEELGKRFARLDLPVNYIGERRGLTCDLVSDPDAVMPRLALRGDIDALPIQDAKTVDYRSCQDGVMHACGHDVHAAVIYGAMAILRSMHQSGQLPWPIAVRAVLQPAEELATGARYMIHHHALRDVSAILSLHVDPTRSVGCIGLRKGTLTANCDIFHVQCNGRGGHGARPHLTHDPIDAITRWVQSSFRRVDRATDPAETVAISIGTISAGHSANVIPDTAELEGTLRTLTAESRLKVLETMEDVCEGVGRETQCQIELQLKMSAPMVVNDAELVDLLSTATCHTLGAGAVEAIELPSMGSEDFSFYLEHIPGAMMRLGVAGEQVGRAPLHTSLFDVDERAIADGAKVLATAAILHFAP